MVDIFSIEKRSLIMSKVKGANTRPEIFVRKILHSLGYRFRLNVSKLPGKPDIVLTKHKRVVFVHGCFWHSHTNCKRAKLPATNVEFWESKLRSNVERDAKNIAELQLLGWQVLVVWTCEAHNKGMLEEKLKGFMQYGTAQTTK